ncbi:MAG: glycosyltransferase N-terminal domain-containing protein [Crocinitomix sp.]|nr:glycosyltransferase N-terminal domain-containing protein [Crocinitomix sp.]
MSLLYTIGVRGYSFMIRVASLWNPKAKKWMQGRKDAWAKLDSWKRSEVPVYWFHCASLGEFEQGRPLIEKLKSTEDCQIVITFFSPSGYEIRKGYDRADLIIYLPQETQANVNRFLAKVKPSKVFFVKYEFWAKYIFTAKKEGAAVYSISAVFRKDQVFFRSYGGYMLNILKAFDHIFVQHEKSAKLLHEFNVESTVSGDTRYDRVMENAKKVKRYPELEKFIDGKKVLVVGSSWVEDEAVMLSTINDSEFDWKVIVAPHEIDKKRVGDLVAKFDKLTVRYSEIENVVKAEVLVIDNIGMLMNVYQYADLAYVGGAFGKGLHNILEPACFGVPVIFGNSFAKFQEASDFIEHGSGFSVQSESEFKAQFAELKVQDKRDQVLKFMNKRVGATDLIHGKIKA